jgi:hypothetical protein
MYVYVVCDIDPIATHHDYHLITLSLGTPQIA